MEIEVRRTTETAETAASTSSDLLAELLDQLKITAKGMFWKQVTATAILVAMLAAFLRYGLCGESGALWTLFSFVFGCSLALGAVVAGPLFQDRRNAIKNAIQNVQYRLKRAKLQAATKM